jgi:hypothetical protein
MYLKDARLIELMQHDNTQRQGRNCRKTIFYTVKRLYTIVFKLFFNSLCLLFADKSAQIINEGQTGITTFD